MSHIGPDIVLDFLKKAVMTRVFDMGETQSYGRLVEYMKTRDSCRLYRATEVPTGRVLMWLFLDLW